MPIINSAVGRINKLFFWGGGLTIDDIEIINQAADFLGHPDSLVYFFLCHDSVRRNTTTLGTPAQLKHNVRTVERGENSKSESDSGEKSIKGYHKKQNMEPSTDYVSACIKTDGSHWMHFDKDREQFLDDLYLLLGNSHNLNFITERTRLKLQGGDYISGENFLLIGPGQVRDKRLRHYKQEPFYWNLFADTYGYSHDWIKSKVLLFDDADKFKDVWNGGHSLYHLDLYLTYVGRDNGKERFYLATVSKYFDEKCSDTSLKSIQEKNKLNEYLCYVRIQLHHFFGEHLIVEELPTVVFQTMVFSFNNALVEITKKSRRILVPLYKNTRTKEEIMDAVNEARKDTLKIMANYFKPLENNGSNSTVQKHIVDFSIPDYYISEYTSSLHCIAMVNGRV